MILTRKGRGWLVLLMLCMAGCETLGLKDSDEDRMRHELALWSDGRIHDYAYHVQVGCFCPIEVIEPVTVTVRGDSIVSIVPDTIRTPATRHQSYTVSELFSVVQDAIDTDQDYLEVRYDQTFHYPTYISYSRKNALDSGMRITASEFRPLK